MAAKYIIQPGIKECDFWGESGKIQVSKNCTQKELETLYNAGFEGVLKIDSPKG